MQHDKMEDERLIQAFLSGDYQAFNSLVSRWQKKIHHFAYRYFADSDDAAEITQKTFISAYKKLNTLNDVQKFEPWLYRIANNLCLDELKRAGRKRSVSLEILKIAPQTETVKRADSILERNEALVLLHKALLQLPNDQRMCLLHNSYYYNYYMSYSFVNILGLAVILRMLG